jgi:nucleoside-diphosphate-sugar epimerase
VDAVVHLAAIIVPMSESNPDLAYDINVSNIVSAIEAMEGQPLVGVLLVARCVRSAGQATPAHC